jgi:Rrf2 family iron-sulfur cluster assembly transcriptional regulator
MHVKTKGRLAVTAMIDLALHSESRPVALSALSRRQGISMSYLEQLFGKLRRHCLVESLRGPGGGYRLCRPVEEISVVEIVAAVDEALDESALVDAPASLGEPANRCVTEALWASLAVMVNEHLASISLKALVDQQPAPGASLEEYPVRKGIYPRAADAPVRVRTPNSVFAFADAMSPGLPAPR